MRGPGSDAANYHEVYDVWSVGCVVRIVRRDLWSEHLVSLGFCVFEKPSPIQADLRGVPGSVFAVKVIGYDRGQRRVQQFVDVSHCETRAGRLVEGKHTCGMSIDADFHSEGVRRPERRQQRQRLVHQSSPQ